MSNTCVLKYKKSASVNISHTHYLKGDPRSDAVNARSTSASCKQTSGFCLRRASISLQTFAFYARQFFSGRANGFKIFKRPTRRGRREFDALFAFGVNAQ